VAVRRGGGRGTGGLGVGVGGLGRDDGGVVALDLLQPGLAACRQVVGHVRAVGPEVGVVDDVQVRLLADGDNAAVAEASCVGRVGRETPHEFLDRPALLLAAPIGQEPGRIAGIDNEPDVGAAV